MKFQENKDWGGGGVIRKKKDELSNLNVGGTQCMCICCVIKIKRGGAAEKIRRPMYSYRSLAGL